MADNTDGRKFLPVKCYDVDDLNRIRIGKVVSKLCVNEKQISRLLMRKRLIFKWAQRGMIPRPSDYESAALTN